MKLASTAFVPYAGDQWYLHRQQDPEGEFFWKVAQQGHNRNLPRNVTRQGIYVATAAGELLASDHFHPSVPRMTALLRGALQRAAQQGKAEAVIETGAADGRYARVPPPGGLILKVFSRIPLEPGGRWTPNQATGRDHAWLTSAEARSLAPPEWKPGARRPLSAAIAERLVRFHLVDNVRGEPDFWRREEVRQADLSLVVEDAAGGRLRLEGTARMEAAGRRPRGYDARLQGTLVLDRAGGRVTRCDLLAWGDAWGEGTYTGGAPPGRFPLLIAFSLAGKEPVDLVPPQASRDAGAYMGTRGLP